MKSKISGIINIIIGGFLLIAVNTFLIPCQGVMEMPCSCSTKGAELILILVIIISIGKFFVNDTKGKFFLNLSVIAAGIELLFIPTIGKCQVPSMSCNTKTFPAIIIGALLLIAFTVIFTIADLIGGRKRKNADSK
ncbi:MAG: DUF4418 family protein [Clostridia bacterium]|nr:DUF4418 family protein [Clostridia bacterium]MBR2175806.1 DUF4418 family protein [Clostridia bacterium]